MITFISISVVGNNSVNNVNKNNRQNNERTKGQKNERNLQEYDPPSIELDLEMTKVLSS